MRASSKLARRVYCSTGNSGEVRADLEGDVLVVAEAGGHSLDDLATSLIEGINKKIRVIEKGL
jgi:hypothetical protein